MSISFVRFAVVTFFFAVPALAVSVRSTGARGDGRADDTDAIQQAVNAGGTVELPTGTYRLTRPIAINLDKTGPIALIGTGTARVVMAGAGAAFQLTGTLTGTAGPTTIKPDVWERQRTPRIDGLEILGAHPEADGIAATGTIQLTITRVVVREARHAIRLHGRNRNVIISDVHLYNNRGIGVFFDAANLHQTNITGSHISYNDGGGIVVRGGNVFNIQIGNCDLERNMAPDRPPTANVLIDSTGGVLGEVAITGCTLQHNAAPGFANIRVLGGGFEPATARAPAKSTREGYVTITGNILSDVAVNVHLKDVRAVTLTGNTMYLGAEHDVLVEDSSHVVVGANNLTLSSRYEKSFSQVCGGVMFKNSRDCTITGLHINGVRHLLSAIRLEGCERMNVTDASILDCDGAGVELVNTRMSQVRGCIIRDDRDAPNAAPAVLVSGGADNIIAGNLLDRAAALATGSGRVRDNEVILRSRERAN